MDGIGALTTDLYQLTMAQVYFRLGIHEQRAQFDHLFRSYPDYGAHQAGYCVAAGLEQLLDWVETAAMGADDVEYLASLRGRAGDRLFDDEFLRWLAAVSFRDGMTVEAVPEGRVVHANAPLTVVTGPLAMAQMLETPLLNLMNYPTLVATKASRISEAARGRPVLEFGLRRGATAQ